MRPAQARDLQVGKHGKELGEGGTFGTWESARGEAPPVIGATTTEGRRWRQGQEFGKTDPVLFPNRRLTLSAPSPDGTVVAFGPISPAHCACLVHTLPMQNCTLHARLLHVGGGA